jgi:hypothetical protein
MSGYFLLCFRIDGNSFCVSAPRFTVTRCKRINILCLAERAYSTLVYQMLVNGMGRDQSRRLYRLPPPYHTGWQVALARLQMAPASGPLVYY